MKSSADLRGRLAARWRDLAVAAGLILVVSLALEQTIRVYMFGAAAFSYAEMKRMVRLGGSGLLQASADPDIAYELKPNLDTRFNLVAFRTNSKGLRDREYELAKPAGAFRVAVIGGSYTMPSGVEIEQAYHSLLEEHLNRESGSARYEFVNFGVGGYKNENKLATLRQKALAWQPDLVLFVLDGFKLTQDRERKRRFVEKPPENGFFQSFALQLLERSRVMRWFSQERASYLERQRGNLDRLDALLGELAALRAATGIPICVVALDHDASSLDLARDVEGLVRKHGLAFASTVPAFQGTSYRGLSVDEIDPHPNTEAHRIFAEVLYRELAEQALLGARLPAAGGAPPEVR